jgi:hypothetical protein
MPMARLPARGHLRLHVPTIVDHVFGHDPLPRLDGEFGFALRDQFGAAGLHLTFGLIDDIHRLE